MSTPEFATGDESPTGEPGPDGSSSGGLTAAGVRPQLTAVADAVLGRADRVEVPLLELAGHEAGSAGAGDEVDVVWAGPDDVALLAGAEGLDGALTAACGALRPGGLVVLPAASLDDLASLHGAGPSPVPGPGPAVSIAAWEFDHPAHSYVRHDLVVDRVDGNWSARSQSPVHHRLPDETEISAALERAGFWSPQLLSTADTGLEMSVWAAIAPGEPAPDGAAVMAEAAAVAAG